jgi:hypothetical protein
VWLAKYKDPRSTFPKRVAVKKMLVQPYQDTNITKKDRYGEKKNPYSASSISRIWRKFLEILRSGVLKKIIISVCFF